MCVTTTPTLDSPLYLILWKHLLFKTKHDICTQYKLVYCE